MPIGRMVVRRFVLHAFLIGVASFSIVEAVPAQPPSAQTAPAKKKPAQEKEPSAESLSAEQLKKEIERLRRDIETQRDSPKAPAAWKELMKAEEDRLENAMSNARREIQMIRQEVSRLGDHTKPCAWRNGIDKMEQRLQQLDIQDWQRTKNEGKLLFQPRHAELAKFAPAETPRLRSLGLDVLNYPRMDGSTSCQPLRRS